MGNKGQRARARGKEVSGFGNGNTSGNITMGLFQGHVGKATEEAGAAPRQGLLSIEESGPPPVGAWGSLPDEGQEGGHQAQPSANCLPSGLCPTVHRFKFWLGP